MLRDRFDGRQQFGARSVPHLSLGDQIAVQFHNEANQLQQQGTQLGHTENMFSAFAIRAW